MIQTLNHYSPAAKTAEIMSRYRPIAPKPKASISTSMSDDHQNPSSSSSISMSQKIQDSPYLRSVWPQLQARPTRTRKRGRTSLGPLPMANKRPRTHLLGLSPSSSTTTSSSASPAQTLSLQGFAHPGPNGLLGSSENPAQVYSNLVTLPFLSSCSCPPPTNTTTTTTIELIEEASGGSEKLGIDLNMMAELIPEEKDLLKNLPTTNVIAPQAVRPVGSSIQVGSISEDSLEVPGHHVHVVKKRAGEVEEEVESEALPAVLSDSNNKVRMANSAYKEMVGQPECSWLDCMGNCGDHDQPCKERICGGVMLQFMESTSVPPVNSSSNGFSCWVRIEWGSNGGKKSSIKAFSDVMRLSCESKDYLFAWRFHTTGTTSTSTSTAVDQSCSTTSNV